LTRADADDRWRTVRIKAAALATGVAAAAATLEVGLRALGDRAPPAVIVQRHDLGEVRRDPRGSTRAETDGGCGRMSTTSANGATATSCAWASFPPA